MVEMLARVRVEMLTPVMVEMPVRDFQNRSRVFRRLTTPVNRSIGIAMLGFPVTKATT